MVTPDEIVLELDDSLGAIRVVFLEQQQQFGLYSGLVVILLLILDHFDCNVLVLLVVSAFDYLAESSFADELAHFEPVANLVTCHNSIVPLCIVEAVVDQPLLLCGLVLLICLRQVPDFFVLLNLS